MQYGSVLISSSIFRTNVSVEHRQSATVVPDFHPSLRHAACQQVSLNHTRRNRSDRTARPRVFEPPSPSRGGVAAHPVRAWGSMVEYAPLVGLIAIALVTAVTLVGRTIANPFCGDGNHRNGASTLCSCAG
jgi:Flp pilus assembly pilin Flp